MYKDIATKIGGQMTSFRNVENHAKANSTRAIIHFEYNECISVSGSLHARTLTFCKSLVSPRGIMVNRGIDELG